MGKVVTAERGKVELRLVLHIIVPAAFTLSNHAAQDRPTPIISSSPTRGPHFPRCEGAMVHLSAVPGPNFTPLGTAPASVVSFIGKTEEFLLSHTSKLERCLLTLPQSG